MSSALGTTGKTPATSVGRRMPSATKGTSRTNRSPSHRTTQALRVTNVSQQTSPLDQYFKSIDDMNNNHFLAPPRPPDPTLYIQAGTTGVRHLFPIHLTEHDCHGGVFPRTISRLRSRTPTTELCTNIEMIRNACTSLKTLQHFDVSDNQLNDLPLDICLLTDLETFNCSHNQLTDIPNLFERLKHLKEIDLSYNLFKILPPVIYSYKSLIRLHCEQNFISTIDKNLLNLKRLKFFIFDHNQLESLEQIDFAQLKKLEYIHIAHNQLIKFPRGLHQLHHLKNVNLSHNRLKTVPIDLFLVHTLDVLNLSHNFISKLPPMPVGYKRAAMIFSIDLSYNYLTKFYEYLLLIAMKVDLSYNKIRMITNELFKKLSYDVICSRDLKINNNPLIQPALPMDILNEDNTNTIYTLRMVRFCLDEQQMDIHVRQGFKIYILGPKNSGKTTLANCLEEYMPFVLEENQEETLERFVHVHQFPFRLTPVNDPSSTIQSVTPPTQHHPSLPPETATSSKTTSTKPGELPKIQLQRFEMDTRKRRTSTNRISKRSSSTARQPAALPVFLPPLSATSILPPVSTVPIEPIKNLPITIYDFNGSPDYYQHISPFIDLSALHFLCIHSEDFHRNTPANIEEIFNEKFDISSSIMLKELFQLLQILCEKATKTRAIMILPIATCIDLFDEKFANEKKLAEEKINTFFKFYLQYRIDRIKNEMGFIQSLQTISSSLSDRLKTYTSLINIPIHIEPCQSISSVTFENFDELNRTIQRCVLNQKAVFPHVDRILPTLWAETNQYIESLADTLSVPYLLWNAFTNAVTTKHGLPHLINEITMSLHDEGKIFVLNEICTTNRVVFLRPSWLTDLLYSLFRHDMSTTYLDYDKNEIYSLNNLSESRFQVYKKEFLQYGLLHCDLLRCFWGHLLNKKDNLHEIWFILMRFLLIAYPKMNKEHLKRLVQVHTPDSSLRGEKSSNQINDLKLNNTDDDRFDIKFEYAIVPYYLPLITENERNDELKNFHNRLKNILIVRYTSQSLPLAFFHRLTVSMILRLNIIYKKHWKDFILGEHEEKDVRFLMETDHQTYIICHCGTNIVEQPLEDIWNILMPILNHFEEMFTNLAPSNRFDRSVQCPYCKQFSFMGEWTTPKELQCLKIKACPSCNANVNTARLVQPNESKRRSEELLKRIRERRAKTANKESDDASTPTTHLIVPSV